MSKLYYKILDVINKNWSDPVWSKVISAIIIGIGAFIIGLIRVAIPLIIGKDNLISVFTRVWNYLRADESFVVNRFFLYITVLIAASFVLPFIISLFKKLKYFKRHDTQFDASSSDEPAIIYDRSTVFFENRIADAFPGLRGLKWYNGIDAAKRLSMVLKQPLFFSADSPHVNNPIWWFRGSRNSNIKSFKIIKGSNILINYHEFVIDQIAVYRGDVPEDNFIYVQTKGDSPTGVYSYSQETRKQRIEKYGYDWEEYGIFNGKYKISREQYDDGAAEIRGKVIERISSELRVRYLTNYNFIIAPIQSPINSREFDKDSDVFLNGILNGTKDFEDLIDFLATLEESVCK